MSEVTVTIRNAKLEELTRIMEIYACAKRFMEAHGNHLQWSGDDEVKRERIQEMLEQNLLFVGAEGEMLHFVFAYIQGEDPTYRVIDGAWLNGEAYGTIHRLASAGTVKGVVSRITRWALEQNDNLRIDTHQDNLVMQNALKKAGFTCCGTIYLENGDPRIAYQKVRELQFRRQE